MKSIYIYIYVFINVSLRLAAFSGYDTNIHGGYQYFGENCHPLLEGRSAPYSILSVGYKFA